MPDDDGALAVMQRFLDAYFGPGNSRRAVDPDELAAALEGSVTDDFVCVMGAPGMAQRFEGLDGLRQAWGDFLEAFDGVTVVGGELELGPDGNTVVQTVRIEAVPPGASHAIDQESTAVYRTRGGLVAAVEYHSSRASGLASAGLDPA